MESHEIGFLSKALDHDHQTPEDKKQMFDAVTSSFFGGVAQFGVPKSQKVENTISHMLSYSGWTMKELTSSLTFGCKKNDPRKEGSWSPKMHSEKTNITSSIKGYLFKVRYDDFAKSSFSATLGFPQYLQSGERGIILEPEFGRYTRQMIEALDELNGNKTIRKDPAEAMNNAIRSLPHLNMNQLKSLKNEIDWAKEKLLSQQYDREMKEFEREMKRRVERETCEE